MNPVDSLTPLEQALAAKGIGPKGLKPLSDEVILSLSEEMATGDRDVLSAVVLMGFLVLESKDGEWNAFDRGFDLYGQAWSEELRCLYGMHRPSGKICEGNDVLAWIFKLIQHEDLSPEQCHGVVDYLLSPVGREVYKAALLQGLRVKRESDGENEALYKRLFSRAQHVESDHDLIVDLSMPYDGMVRSIDKSLELAALLSEMGLSVVCHGVRGLGPKFGESVVTRFDESNGLGFDLALSGLDKLGVAIVEQKESFMDLFHLLPLRNSMRKRPFLATLEKMLMPIRARKNVLVTGYVHSAYRDSIPELISRSGYWDKMLLVKGMEGAIFLDPRKSVRAMSVVGGRVDEYRVPNYVDIINSPSEGAHGDSVQGNEVSLHWWKFPEGEDRASLLYTASTILDFVLGDEGRSDRMERMEEISSGGRLDDRLEQLLVHYQSV